MSKEIQAIIRGLADSHSILAGMVGEMTEEQLARKRGKGAWTVAEHVAHLAKAQPMILGRLRRMLAEDTPEFVPFFPDKDEEVEDIVPPVAESLAGFKAARDEILALLHIATEADWARLAKHPEYVQYGVHILARHILMHDHWHMYRMEELWLTTDEYFEEAEG